MKWIIMGTLILLGAILAILKLIKNHKESTEIADLFSNTYNSIKENMDEQEQSQGMTNGTNEIPQALNPIQNTNAPTFVKSNPTALEGITNIIDNHNTQVGGILEDLTAIMNKLDPSLVESLNSKVQQIENDAEAAVTSNSLLGKINGLLGTKSVLLSKVNIALDILKTVI